MSETLGGPHSVDANDEELARGVDRRLRGQVDGLISGERVGPGLPRVQLIPECADLRVAHPYDGVLPLQCLLQSCPMPLSPQHESNNSLFGSKKDGTWHWQSYESC